MRFALIPDRDEYLNDRAFDIYDEVANRDHLVEPIFEMQQCFANNGDVLHTIDKYGALDEIDYFLFLG